MEEMTLVVIGKNNRSLDEWQESPLGNQCNLVLWANGAGESLAGIGNRFLDESQDLVVGLVHADCTIQTIQPFLKSAMDGKICGIVGRDAGKGNRWCSNVEDSAGDGGVGSLRPGPVTTLDSCSVFLRRDLGLRFDSVTFDGCHCWIEDLCLQAREMGILVEVPAAQASHRGDSTYDPFWQAQYRIYRMRLARKWSHVSFETT